MTIGIPPVNDLMGGFHILLLLWLGWVAVYDWKHHRILDPFSAITAAMGFCSVGLKACSLLGPVRGEQILLLLADSLAGALIGGGTLLLVSLATKGGFGGGDIKLMAGLGLTYGTVGTLMVLFVAVLATLVVGFFKQRHGDKKPRLAFAPFLFMGCLAVNFIMRGF